MAKKKRQNPEDEMLPEAEAKDQYITDTIITNYMPYVMTVIVSRAIPDIDGFKPSHRKLLYTMYKMGLLSGPRTKSTNVVGRTMTLHPHGDAAIYDTMVRLARDHDALLHPFVDSEGSFGKHYSSTTMPAAAPRYTEVRLEKFSEELFRGIDKNAVDMVPNYDNTQEEPSLLPTSFPNVLVSPNQGIAVSMASKISSFNLAEICDGTILLLKRPFADTEKLLELIPAPDFTTGGDIVYDRDKMLDIYNTGRGSFKIRSKYRYDEENNCIDILEIPYSTSIEQILSSITELVKSKTLTEIADFRDEIDISGFKLTLDLKRGVDPDALMRKLFKLTTLEDSFECNFNILINGSPKTLGVRDILTEWIKFRMSCVRRETEFDRDKVREKLHLLYGLAKIILDIDLAIKIVRDTQSEKDVVPNLMAGFDIDEVQAEYVADIRLRSLNSEYILRRTEEIADLEEKERQLSATLENDELIKKIIIGQLNEIKKKYGKARRTTYTDRLIIEAEDKHILTHTSDDKFKGRMYFTRNGYFKKISNNSLRGNDVQSLRDGDSIIMDVECDNSEKFMFFTDRGQAYNSDSAAFEATKASEFGQYVPTALSFDDGEKTVGLIVHNGGFEGNAVFIFANGKGVRVPLSSYQVKGTRRKLVNAISSASPCVYVGYEKEAYDIMLISANGRGLVVNTADIPLMSTRSASGNILMTLKAKTLVADVITDIEGEYGSAKKYRKSVPSAGAPLEKKEI